MREKISDFVQTYDLLDRKFCEQTIQLLETPEYTDWEQHKFYSASSRDVRAISGNNELDVTWLKHPNTNVIMKKIYDVILKYITWLDDPVFCEWRGYSQVRYNRYVKDRVMAKHCDHIHSLFDGDRQGIPTLTVLGTLNDDYKGGDFVMWDDTVVKTKPGQVLVFPSIFLYPHKVEPVTEGTRYSFVSWVW